MTYLRILFLIIGFGLAVTTDSRAQETTTFYVTKTGKKYHKAECHYLKYSKLKIKTSDARFRYYAPCKVCKPATSGENTRSNQPLTASPLRCSAITQAGTRCKRAAKKGQKNCWQHE